MLKKEPLVTKYQTLEVFMTFKKPSNILIQAYLNEFNKRLFRTKSYGTLISGDILAYRLLKPSNLSSYHENCLTCNRIS